MNVTSSSEWTAEDEAIYQASGMSPLKKYYSMGWDPLSSEEKAMMINYRRLLLAGRPIKKSMAMFVTNIHTRHPDFHIGCIPGDPA